MTEKNLELEQEWKQKRADMKLNNKIGCVDFGKFCEPDHPECVKCSGSNPKLLEDCNELSKMYLQVSSIEGSDGVSEEASLRSDDEGQENVGEGEGLDDSQQGSDEVQEEPSNETPNENNAPSEEVGPSLGEEDDEGPFLDEEILSKLEGIEKTLDAVCEQISGLVKESKKSGKSEKDLLDKINTLVDNMIGNVVKEDSAVSSDKAGNKSSAPVSETKEAPDKTTTTKGRGRGRKPKDEGDKSASAGNKSAATSSIKQGKGNKSAVSSDEGKSAKKASEGKSSSKEDAPATGRGRGRRRR